MGNQAIMTKVEAKHYLNIRSEIKKMNIMKFKKIKMRTIYSGISRIKYGFYFMKK